MATKSSNGTSFWEGITYDNRPINGWQKLSVDDVYDVKTDADEKMDWLAGRITVSMKCVVDEGDYQGSTAFCSITVGEFTGTRRDGVEYTTTEEQSIKTAGTRIGRILNLGKHPDLKPELDSDGRDLLNVSRLQTIAESCRGAVFFGNVRSSGAGTPKVGDGARDIRTSDDIPPELESALPDGFIS